MRKKKRRLRLFLITSRLSLPFSSPATNIVDRGSSKIAVWAKQKALGRNLLRKAAILNRIRRRALERKAEERAEAGVLERVLDLEKEQKQLELARLAFSYGSHDTHTRPVLQHPPSFPPTAAVRIGNHFSLSGSPNFGTSPNFRSTSPSRDLQDGEDVGDYRGPNDSYCYPTPPAQLPRRDYIPLPPSPLGLSNYDAFDLEEEFHDPYAFADDPMPDDKEMNDAYSTHDSPNSSAGFGSPLTRVTSGSEKSELIKTPPQTYYSDFNILEPCEAVVGDYDGVDGADGIDAVWPSVHWGGEVKRPPNQRRSSLERLRSPDEVIKVLEEEKKEIVAEKERQRGFMFANLV